MIWIATTLIGIWNSIWGIASPSKVMENSGSQMMKGLAKGIMGGTRGVVAVTEKAASAIFGSFSGSPTVGAGGGTAGQYLNNQGEVMRSNMDVVKGDPCAKDSTAGCLAEKLKKGIGEGIGAGIGSGIGKISDKFNTLAESIDAKIAEMKANFEATMQTIEQKIQTALDNAYAKTIESRDTFIGIARTTGMNIDAWFITQGLKFDEWWRTTKEKIIALPGILDTALVNLANFLNTETKKISTNIATLCTNGAKSLADLCSGVLSWILGQLGIPVPTPPPPPTPTPPPTQNNNGGYNQNDKGEKDNSGQMTSIPYTQSSTSYLMGSVTNNITNNFNGGQSGQQITWDFEAGQFWV
jgi:hypothetical protein